MYLMPPMKGLLLELGIGARRQKEKDGVTGWRKTFDIFIVLIHYTNGTDGKTDRRTQRPTDGHQTTAKTALTDSVARHKNTLSF